MLPSEIHILHTSEFYQVHNFKCNCVECHKTNPEFVNVFNLCFVRSGYFEFEVFRDNLEVHIGRLLVTKPGSEHIARHIDDNPDVCSVFEFTDDFYKSLCEHYGVQWFFNNNDIHSVLLKCTPEMDHLHHLILKIARSGNSDRLQVDDLVLRLVDRVMKTLDNRVDPIPSNLKKFHLLTIENAKNFLLDNFDQNIGMQQLAEHCCVSLFHFSRIFKAVMKVTPHQYLSGIRLNHARILLENTKYPVTQIALQCGFNSVEHFATAYKLKFHAKPSEGRNALVSRWIR